MRLGRICCRMSGRRIIIIVSGFCLVLRWLQCFISTFFLFLLVPTDALRVNHKIPASVSKFLGLRRAVSATSQGLTDPHTFDSRPDSWPCLTCIPIKNVPHMYMHVFMIPAEPLGQRQQVGLPQRPPSYMVAQHARRRHVCPRPKLPHPQCAAGLSRF